mgnify:CR=1 FL=1
MPDKAIEDKRILKNTLFLYMRMILIMLTTLYISREILKILGFEDFGIYNVIAGFVSMFSFLTATISGGTSRFFAYEIGQKNWDRLNKYFRLSIVAFTFLSLIILLLSETFGLWFVKNKLVIPEERFSAALVVYHFSILSFIANMFSIPYKSMVIAYEKMDIYAYIGIIEVVLNLAIVYSLNFISIDKLGLYACLLFLLNTAVTFSFYFYCKTKFKEARFSFFWDKIMFQEFFNYSLWIVIGSLSGLLRGQGLNILLNIFFGPTINAARGIAYQVHSAINQFVNNFYTACRPQITKLYATGDQFSMMTLVFSSSRICYMLTLLFALPIFIETPFILQLWLGEVPDYTVLFTRLVLITILIETISYPFQAAVSATGRIKWYQLITGGLTILTLPVAYAFLHYGYNPEIVFYVTIVFAFIAQLSRLVFMKQLLQMSIISYLKSVILPMALVTIIALMIPVFLYLVLDDIWSVSIIIICTSMISVLISGGLFGLTTEEKNIVRIKIKQIYDKRILRTK